ncbi:hypothetical protein [Pseudodesulfovibrio sp.]|uniref:hypothetical protein n=1 Tax=Pseudodesulfovibrio sp. TaxID=2035812 RepID=UPI0026304A54|nr:hypothetical protein [Pseudodesulfovibrio sp.]MDD3311102.1 hypothetical protein [Pseudodesulfovibrio sp.]
MSDKIPLPDELLDALSGGVFTYQGEITQVHRISRRGIEAETAQGRMFFPWSDKAYREFSTLGGINEKEAMVAALVQHKEYRLEEFAGIPGFVDD